MKRKRITVFAAMLALACLYATSAFAMGTDISVTNAAVNLREGPSTQYAKILTIPAGERVYIVAADVGGWTKVQYQDTEGFVSTQYLGNKKSHPATQGGVTSGNANFGQYATSAAVNLREGPGTSYAVMTVVPAGAKVGVTDYGNGWAHAWYGNYEGYVAIQYLPDLHDIHSGDAQGAAYTTISAVNLRKGRGTGYGVITVVPKGATVNVEDYAYGWAHVNYNGIEGYLYTEYINGLAFADAGGNTEGDMTWFHGEDYSAVYNEEYYAAHNPDVIEAYGNKPGMLIQHFVNYGIYEGRQAKEDFNVETYRSQHPELNERFGDDLHYYYLYACGIID